MKKKGYFAAFLLCVLAVSAFLFWPEKGEKEERRKKGNRER